MNVTLEIGSREQCGCFYDLALEQEVEKSTINTSKSNVGMTNLSVPERLKKQQRNVQVGCYSFKEQGGHGIALENLVEGPW